MVRIFQPIHGYYLRRELMTWRADQWAALNPGSVYNALKTLTKDGFLEEVEGERTSSRLTTDGELEFQVLLREALRTVDPHDPSRLLAALAFMLSLTREEVIAALESRIAQIDAARKPTPFTVDSFRGDPNKPARVAEHLLTHIVNGPDPRAGPGVPRRADERPSRELEEHARDMIRETLLIFRRAMRQVFVPGLLVQLGIFGAAFVGFGLIAELRAGVVERMRVTPASRAALLLGRVLRDVVVLLVQGLVLVLVATAFGLRAPLGGLVLGLLVVGLLGAAFASASYAAALVLTTEDSMAAVTNSLAVPLLLLSGILLPMTLAPGWLRGVSDANPLKHVVDGVRELFLGRIGTWTVFRGLVAAMGLVLAGILVGTRTFQRESS